NSSGNAYGIALDTRMGAAPEQDSMGSRTCGKGRARLAAGLAGAAIAGDCSPPVRSVIESADWPPAGLSFDDACCSPPVSGRGLDGSSEDSPGESLSVTVLVVSWAVSLRLSAPSLIAFPAV